LTRDSDTAAGLEAYERHDWKEAYQLLSPLLESEDETPELAEAIGSASWWVGDIDMTISARQRAYAEYSAAGRTLDAARAAIQVAEDHMLLLQSSTASGWMGKARSLLDDESLSSEHGHLLRLEAILANSLSEAIELSVKVHEIGVELGEKDLEMLGLHDGGRFLVASGEVDRGMAMMEEAMVGVVAGELTPKATGRIFCNMIETCASMADYGRAIEWSDQTMRWCEGLGNAGGYPGVCRVRRSEFMRLRGAWPDAEAEASRAVDDLAHILPYMGEAFNELGMVRLNLGDLDRAEEAFRKAHALGTSPMPGLALLKLAQGDAAEGFSMLQTRLEALEGLTTRSKLLPAAVEVALAASDLVAARQHSSELASIAERFDSDVLKAFSLESAGRIAAADGEPADAVSLFQEAVEILLASGLPYEAARARRDLGNALIEVGSEGSGRLEIDAALAEFERLGASLEVDRLLRVSVDPVPDGRREKLVTMMFTDIVGSTDLVGVIGDESWADLIAWHDRTVRIVIEEFSGNEIDHAGDGFFVSFDSPDKALGCAAQIQRTLRAHRKKAGFSPRVRIGIHLGSVVQTHEGLVGQQVHIAARVASAGEGDEVLVSLETMDRVSGFDFERRRAIPIKGISEPLMVGSLVWAD
jgi:class 3 adenylate cyclase